MQQTLDFTFINTICQSTLTSLLSYLFLFVTALCHVIMISKQCLLKIQSLKQYLQLFLFTRHKLHTDHICTLYWKRIRYVLFFCLQDMLVPISRGLTNILKLAIDLPTEVQQKVKRTKKNYDKMLYAIVHKLDQILYCPVDAASLDRNRVCTFVT